MVERALMGGRALGALEMGAKALMVAKEWMAKGVEVVEVVEDVEVVEGAEVVEVVEVAEVAEGAEVAEVVTGKDLEMERASALMGKDSMAKVGLMEKAGMGKALMALVARKEVLAKATFDQAGCNAHNESWCVWDCASISSFWVVEQAPTRTWKLGRILLAQSQLLEFKKERCNNQRLSSMESVEPKSPKKCVLWLMGIGDLVPKNWICLKSYPVIWYPFIAIEHLKLDQSCKSRHWFWVHCTWKHAWN